MGPTASGKTELALALARRHPLEIISVDSALVYRGLEIGAARPSAEELAAVPHHLVNHVDPAEVYSAARFRREALEAMASIAAAGRIPLLVGGTMLYFKVLRDGLSALPPANAELRRQLEQRAATEGWPALHAELVRVDPETAARLHPNHSQRIQRAWRATTSVASPSACCNASPPPLPCPGGCSSWGCCRRIATSCTSASNSAFGTCWRRGFWRR